VTTPEFNVEGESGSEADEHDGAGPQRGGNRSDGEGDAAPVHHGLQAEDRPGSRRLSNAGRGRGVVAAGGLYSSHLTTWRAARERGDLAGAAKKRGPARRVADPRDKRITELERESTRWRQRAERAEALVELQKQVAALLGTPSTEPS